MDHIKLSRLNVRHLVVLQLLLETHSVNLTATRLCISASAVSKMLSQLRLELSDELFYRSGNQLVATAYAKSLRPAIVRLVTEFEALFYRHEFNPEQFNGTFTIALRDSSFELFCQQLFIPLINTYPNIKFELQHKALLGLNGLYSGQVDFVILPHDKSQPPSTDEQIMWQTLVDDEMICLMDPDHPLAAQELSLDNYLSYAHIGITDVDLGQPFFEIQLAQQELNRRVVINAADFGTAALLLRGTELLFTCSKKWADMAYQAQGLISKQLPFNYGEVVYSIVCQQQSLNDPAKYWLYQYLLAQINAPLIQISSN